MNKILFVCLGNICRSPTAHGVFQRMVYTAGREDEFYVDSAGTIDYHKNAPPDSRMQNTAQRHGYDLSYIRSRKVHAADFEEFDLVLAMDEINLGDLQQQCPEEYLSKLNLFLSYHPQTELISVPDPYYGGLHGFEQVMQLVEETCEYLLRSFSTEKC